MIITCEACSTQFVLDDALVKPGGSKVRCSKCRHVFTAFPVETPEAPPAIEIPDPPEPEIQDLPFDEPEIQDQLEFNVSEDDDFSINSDSDNQDPDLEETDIEFLEIEIDDPEPDFQDDALELDTQDFEFEDGTSSGPASVSAESDEDTADIEISFAQNEGAGADPEPEELSFDMDDLSLEESSIDEFELDIKKDEAPELEFDDDPQADFIIEDDNLPSNGVKLESGDNKKPDGNEAPDDQNTDGDEEIEQTVSEQDKFAEYDKVLEQETEPENDGVDIPDPEVEDNTSQPAPPLSPPDDEIETTTEALIDQTPLISPPSAQSVRQKRGAKKKGGVSLPVKILLVLSLLVMAAYVAIIRLGVAIPVVSGIQIPVITEWLQPKPAPQPPLNPVPDEPSINGRFVSNKSAGDLFIVTGRIKNPSNTAVSYIQVKGTLMTKGNTKAGTLTAYCGNIIPEETLKYGNISDITKQMGVREGNQNTNVDVKPGASVMFMLVFSNLPEDLANFTVAVQGFEPAEK